MSKWKHKSIDLNQLLIVVKALLKLQELNLSQKLYRAKQQFTIKDKNVE